MKITRFKYSFNFENAFYVSLLGRDSKEIEELRERKKIPKFQEQKRNTNYSFCNLLSQDRGNIGFH